MKAAKTWWLLGLVGVAGFASASCGKDEGTEGGGGSGMIIGGSGGSGGSQGRAGGGSGPTTGSATKLGQACVTDTQCEDSKAPGLTCVGAKDSLGSGAPPKGLCTKECGSDDDCSDVGAGALCFPFGSETEAGHCIEACSFGTPNVGEQKCHDRPEFACNPALLGRTSATCESTDDCQAGELCIDGTCDIVFPGCLPACRGDIDCEPGMYCDQSFLSGVCVTEKPTGKALGEPCTVPGENEPSEPDECLGFCQADEATGNKGHCAATCALATQCAWNAKTEKFDGVCFYASVLTSETGDAGDFGFCTPTCNCTAECNDPDLACSLLSQGALPDDFKGPGLCFSPDAMTKEYNQCEGAGGSGAGGADSTGTAGMPSMGGEASGGGDAG
jgi:hypothetical protein